MENESQSPFPQEILGLRHIDGNKWEFKYPRLTRRQWDQLYELIDLWNSDEKGNISKAEKGYRSLLKTFPEFIDAYHHLAILLDETDRFEEAVEIWQRAVNIGFGCFPPSFSIGQDQLPWELLDNRPFLRAYHALGLVLMDCGEIENALSIFANILLMNPNDNQGVRSLAIDCNLALNRPWEVLGISQQYLKDITSNLVYGRVLALYQMGLTEEAKTALGEAIEYLPLVAKEIIKKRHRRPKEFYSDYVTVGGPDEAYHYWIQQGQYWKLTLGAIDFIRTYLAENGQ